MKVLDLFAGIGGFSLGLEWAGMEIAGQVEIDPRLRQVLAYYWPDAARWGDVKEMTGAEIAEKCGTIDLVCGGFPCQPHSVAGKRKGRDDPRNLWPEMLRICREIRPRWVVAENVPGIITTILDEVSIDLENEGYEVRPVVFPACAVGAPHVRERIFIVAHTKSINADAHHSYAVEGCEQKPGESIGGSIDNHRAVTHANSKRQERPAAQQIKTRRSFPAGAVWVPAESPVLAGDDGLPGWMVAAAGNAVVPQAVEIIGKAIMAVET